MEHSYSRDFRPMDSSQTLSTRTLMVHRAPQCPSCHVHTHDERIDLDESYNPPIPSYDEEDAQKAMHECAHLISTVRNVNSEDADWEEKINTIGWSVQQIQLFGKITSLLDADRLARLTTYTKQHEPVHRRVVIDKSVSRLRQALAGVSWDTRLTQWIHGLLMESLPPSYLAAYIDVLQTLKSKLPTLVDKMVFGYPMNVNQEVLGPVLKEPWEPIVAHKNRKLPGEPFIVIVPSGLTATYSARIQKWFTLFATMAPVVPISFTISAAPAATKQQTLQYTAEQMVALARSRILEIRCEAPNRPIILVGFNTGAALALQIGLVESVSSIICLGFGYNTVNGPRGAPDDHIVDVSVPVLFVVGQNSARTSQEEIEMLRERMIAQTALVVVGSADDCLRVSKTKRKIEGVTQCMVNNMIADEIAEFASNCLTNPPRPKQSIKDPNVPKSNVLLTNSVTNRVPTPPVVQRKRKSTAAPETANPKSQKRSTNKKTLSNAAASSKPRLASQVTQDALDNAIKSILPETTPEKVPPTKLIDTFKKSPTFTPIVTSGQIAPGAGGTKIDLRSLQTATMVSGTGSSPIVLPIIKRETTSSNATATIQSNIKVVPADQFVQLKPAAGTTQFVSLKPTMKTIVSVSPKTPAAAMLTPKQEPFSPKKFTIVRNATGVSTTASTGDAEKPPPDLSNTDIFDIPIVFADNDGNIQDSSLQKAKEEAKLLPGTIITFPSDGQTTTTPVTVTSPSSSATASTTVSDSTVGTSSTPLNRFVTIQSAAVGSAGSTAVKGSKFVVINNKMLTPVGNTAPIAAGIGNKFPKVLITKPTSAVIGSATKSTTSKNLSQLLSGAKVEIVTRAGVKQAVNAVSCQQKFQPVFIQAGQTKTVSPGTTNISAAPSGTTVTPTATSGKTILIKPANSSSTRTPMLSRNLSLRKLNLVASSTVVSPSVSKATTRTTTENNK